MRSSILDSSQISLLPTSLNLDRRDHSATLLPNGQVLVVGGDENDFSFELFDPATDTWTTSADGLNEVRIFHTASLLSDGRVLVVGGKSSWGDDPVRTFELFDPGVPPAGNWTMPTETLDEGRIGHTATTLSDGRVVVVGGSPNSDSSIETLDTCEIYDPNASISEHWTTLTATLVERRAWHTATLLNDGSVLVVGGFGGVGGYDALGSAEIFDPLTGSWRTVNQRLQDSRGGHSATLLADGRVLISGGSLHASYVDSVEVFDPATEMWSRSSVFSPGRTRRNHNTTLYRTGIDRRWLQP